MEGKIKLFKIERFWNLQYQNAFTPKQLDILSKSAICKEKIKNIDTVRVNDDIVGLIINISDKEHILIKENMINLSTEENDDEQIKSKLIRIGTKVNNVLGEEIGKYEIILDKENIILDNFDLEDELLTKNLLKRLQTQYAEFGKILLIFSGFTLQPKDKDDEGSVFSASYKSPTDKKKARITFNIHDERVANIMEKFL